MSKKLIGLWDVGAMLRAGKTPQEIADVVFPQMNKRIKEMKKNDAKNKSK